ncbi:MAG: GNAT family N-acetyltransferase [Chloroflexi bacterium]|nr:GNAT family N-acetyltransferase [Chloroflexota bacterium]
MSLKSKTLEQQFQLMQLTPRDLGDGLVLRTTTPSDTEPLAEFTGRVFGREQVDQLAVLYARDMMRESHPIIGTQNVLVVEDTRAQKIVSTMCLIPQTWTYAGIPFGVGRPEMVATDPDYRRRGLVRKQFEVLHAMSESMGHMVQGITGISWYYRQFDYEYALDLGGGRTAFFSNIPTLKENETEPYRLRDATIDDIPFLSVLYDRDCARSLVACPRPDWLWRYMLEPLPESMAWRVPYQIIETNDGRAVGYFAPSREIWMDAIPIFELSVLEGQSLRAVMPTILRWMKILGEAEAAKQNKTIKGITLAFGREHPAYNAIPDMLPRTRIPYGWYIRVPDVPKFIRHLAPVLQNRLAHSVVAGYSGELKISEYRRGFKLSFDNGALTNVEMWQPMPGEEGECGFPPLVFLQLLFCRKSMMELREMYADVWAKDEAQVLLDALFPKMYSCVYQVS